MIKQALLIVTAVNQIQGLDIIKSPLSHVNEFKCVSHTAFRKFDHYLGKVMNKNMTDDVIYCDYQLEHDLSFLEQSDVDQSMDEASGGRNSTKEL